MRYVLTLAGTIFLQIFILAALAEAQERRWDCNRHVDLFKQHMCHLAVAILENDEQAMIHLLENNPMRQYIIINDKEVEECHRGDIMTCAIRTNPVRTNINAIEILLSHGYDPALTDRNGFPRGFRLRGTQAGTIRLRAASLFLEAGLDPNLLIGTRPLWGDLIHPCPKDYLPGRSYSDDMLELFAKHGANLSAAHFGGANYLHWFAAQYWYQRPNSCLERAAQTISTHDRRLISAPDDRGWLPIDYVGNHVHGKKAEPHFKCRFFSAEPTAGRIKRMRTFMIGLGSPANRKFTHMQVSSCSLADVKRRFNME